MELSINGLQYLYIIHTRVSASISRTLGAVIKYYNIIVCINYIHYVVSCKIANSLFEWVDVFSDWTCIKLAILSEDIEFARYFVLTVTASTGRGVV